MAPTTSRPDSTTAVLRIEKASVDYGGLTALNAVDLSIAEGEIVVVFGESGCGKSVLFRCLAGLEEPSRGRIFIQGQDLYGVGEQKRLGLLRHLGVAHQTGALLKSLTAFDNILLPLKESGAMSLNAARERVTEILERLRIKEVAPLYPAQLSRGEVKGVALARALALEPDILVCDDIFSGLTWSTQLKIFELFADLAQVRGTSIVAFTPAPEVALRLAHRLVILDRGQIVAVGRPDEILKITDAAVERVFHSHLRAFQETMAVPQRRSDPAPPEPAP